MKPAIGVTLRITLAFVLFAAALLSIVGVLSYRSGRDALEAAAVSELLTSALAKEERLDALADRQAFRLSSIASSPSLLSAMQTRLSGADMQARDSASARLDDELHIYTRETSSGMIMLAVADPVSGQFIASAHSRAPPDGTAALTSVATERFFLEGKRHFHVELPHLSRFVAAPAIAVSRPLHGGDGKLLGVLIGWIKLDGISLVTRQTNGLHYSDDSYLINRDAQFVTQPRFLEQNGVLSLTAHTEAARRCMKGNSGILLGADYRGVPTIAAYRWLPRHQLGLITTRSQEEAYSLVRDFRQTMLLIGALVLLASSAIAVALARTITRPLRVLQQAVARYGRGEGGSELALDTRDELGELAREFKRMASAIDEKEAQLRASAAAELDRFFDLSLDLLCIASMDGYFKRLNPAWEKTLGHTRAELLSRPCVEFIHPDDRAQSLRDLDLQLAGTHSGESERRYRCKDGSYRWLSWQAVPAADSGLIYAVARDVTERKQQQVDLNKAKEAAELANHAKGAFLANMSHEIRTPMNGVIGLAALLMKTALTSQQREYMHLLKTSADALLRLLNDILDFSKMEEGKLALDNVDFELRDAIGATLKAFSATANEKRIALSCQVAPEVPLWFSGDAGRLTQIIINLIGNALKFTHEGEVVLRVTRQAGSDSPGELHFCVSDTGIGIPPTQQRHIFNAFAQADNSTTRRYGGTGLGLAIVSQLVALMGGRLWLDSEPGRGTSFHFTVRLEVALDPPAKPVAAPAAALENRQVLVSQPLSILVVEDHPINQTLVVEVLKARGHFFALASNGKEAVALWEKMSFDVILMDGHMPGMDGYEASRAIRAREQGSGKHVRIIALTANAMLDDRAMCLAAGMDDYLAKPIDPDALLECVESGHAPFAHALPAPTAPLPERPRFLSFDLEQARVRSRGRDALLRKMAALFIDGLPASLSSLQDAADARDGQRIERAAHRLKGAAMTLGATGLVHAAGALEMLGHDATFAPMPAALAALRDQADQLKTELRIFLGEAA